MKDKLELEEYYSPKGDEFRGYIIKYGSYYLSTDGKWTCAQSHAFRITPDMLNEVKKIMFNLDLDK